MNQQQCSHVGELGKFCSECGVRLVEQVPSVEPEVGEWSVFSPNGANLRMIGSQSINRDEVMGIFNQNYRPFEGEVNPKQRFLGKVRIQPGNQALVLEWYKIMAQDGRWTPDSEQTWGHERPETIHLGNGLEGGAWG